MDFDQHFDQLGEIGVVKADAPTSEAVGKSFEHSEAEDGWAAMRKYRYLICLFSLDMQRTLEPAGENRDRISVGADDALFGLPTGDAIDKELGVRRKSCPSAR